MAELITLIIDGQTISVPPGTTVAAAVAIAGKAGMRRSVTGESRAALCGMGICFECRVTVNGRSQVRSCLTTCQNQMVVGTDE